MYRSVVSLALAICSLILSGLSVAASAQSLPPPQKVAPHTYAWIGPLEPPTRANRGYRMNMVFVVGKDAIAVIDSGYSEAMAKEMLQHIQKISKKPVRYVVNTSSQPHRYFGNEVFRRQGAQIIASAPEAQRMAKQGPQFAQAVARILDVPVQSVVAPRQPDRIITERTEVDLGGVKLVLEPFGPAHTPGPIVVSVPQDRVVYAGDVLYGGRLLAVIDGGSVKGWLEGYKALGSHSDALFIPGHGNPGRLSDFQHPTQAYLSKLHAHMTKKVEEGAAMQDAIRSFDQSAWKQLAMFEELAGRNASNAYLEAESAYFGK